MGDTTDFMIGNEVSCTDGTCGELKRVVVDPIAHKLTHLVVEPKHKREGGRLVPVDLVTSTENGIHLSCTTTQFEALEDAEETEFLPGQGEDWGYGRDQSLAWPYYPLGMGSVGLGGIEGMGSNWGLGQVGIGPQAITYDRVPVGEVEVRRGEHVHASDGAIGKVKGLVVDPGDGHVTHVLLDEGHLWGQKRVAIPIGAVKDHDDGVRLNLTKDQVRDLPTVEVGEHD